MLLIKGVISLKGLDSCNAPNTDIRAAPPPPPTPNAVLAVGGVSPHIDLLEFTAVQKVLLHFALLLCKKASHEENGQHRGGSLREQAGGTSAWTRPGPPHPLLCSRFSGICLTQCLVQCLWRQLLGGVVMVVGPPGGWCSLA